MYIQNTKALYVARYELCVFAQHYGVIKMIDCDALTLVLHYSDVIMTTIASQMTSLTAVYSTVYLDADQSKHQSSASLAFVWGIHRDRWIPRTKGQLRGKRFHLMTSSWYRPTCGLQRNVFSDTPPPLYPSLHCPWIHFSFQVLRMLNMAVFTKWHISTWENCWRKSSIDIL